MRASIVVVVAALAGCAGTRPTHETTAGPGGASAMKPEFKPRAAFRAHAAKLLHAAPGEMHGGAGDAQIASAGEHSRGGAWHYVVWRGEDTTNSVRGWVTANGTVITPDQNLGVLFAEAGVWAKPPTHTPDELANMLAEDIVWAYGSYGLNVELVTMRIWGLGPPELTLRPDGSGTLRFFSNDHGGASIFGGGAPPDVYWQNDAVLTADHKVTLTKLEFKPRHDQ